MGVSIDSTTIGCLMCCGPTKPISHFEVLSTPTTVEFGLLKVPELSCKLKCTTTQSRCDVDLSHLPLSGPFHFEEMLDSGFEIASVTGERHANTLQNRIKIQNRLTDKYLLESTTFMQNDASPDIARQVERYLEQVTW